MMLKTLFGLLATLLTFGASIPTAHAGTETMRAFPTYAYVDGEELVVPVHVWVFEQEDDLLRRAAVKPLEEALDIDDDPKAQSLFRVRMLDFMVDNERGEDVFATLSGPGIEATEQKVGETPANGHVQELLRVPYKPKKGVKSPVFTLKIRVEGYDATAQTLKVPLISPKGVSLVTDIDDTVKHTNVLDKQELLKNSFARPFQSVPGMPARVNALAKKHRADVHYLSASPWNLYRDLEDWRGRAGLPDGTYHLRMFRAKDFRRTVAFLESSQPHKEGTLDELAERFPARTFILVGDSGEKDPEIYGAFARRYPNQIEAVVIREVPGADNSKERFGKAFEGLDAKKWSTVAAPFPK